MPSSAPTAIAGWWCVRFARLTGAAAIGAGPLRVEIAALAADARVDLGRETTDPLRQMSSGADRPSRVASAASLRLVAGGHTNREIGDRLFISEKTVSVHVSNAMAKLGALSRYEAAASAERLGLLP